MLLQGGRPTYRIEYIGSQKSTCTPKRPNDPYHPSAEEAAVIAAGLNVSGMTDAAAPFWAWAHEGYCSRTAAGVAATIGEFLDKQRARDALTAQVDVVLMLIGHNDAFHAARRCKMREGHTLGPDETAAIAAYGQQQQQQSNPGADPIAASVSSSSASAPASGRLAVEAVLRHKAIRCVWHIIEGEFARDFALLLTAVILKTRPRAVLIGLNPPTGFPAIDEMLHAVIRRTVASYVASTDGADGSSGRAAIRLVAFPGFTRGAHTFDSTHPNAAGAQLLAEAWAAGIRGVFEG
jgi:lysophospholipase L1-like esterase